MYKRYNRTVFVFFSNLRAKINVFSHCFQSLSRAHPPSKPLSTGSSLVGSKAPAGTLKVFRWLKTRVTATYVYRTFFHRVLGGSGFQSWPCLRWSYIRLSLWFTCRKTLSQSMRIEHFHVFFISFLAPFVTMYLIFNFKSVNTYRANYSVEGVEVLYL